MRLSGPPKVILGRERVVGGPLGVAVNLDTGRVSGAGKPLPIVAAPKPRA